MAPARRQTAHLKDLWRQAAEIRREWLGVGLTTEPANRPAAEAAITAIYVRRRRPRPVFVWAESPRAALPHLTGLPTHDTMQRWVRTGRAGIPPVALDIAAGLSHLRASLEAAYDAPDSERPAPKRKKGEPWPNLLPADALDAGMPFQELLRQGVREALFAGLAGVYLPQRAALGGTATVPVGWYGNQDAAWIAYFDAMRRLGLARFPHEQVFDTWVTLARSAGWWWPADDRCVLVERPVVLRTEPAPGARHDEIRLSTSDGKPAVRYRDGWST